MDYEGVTDGECLVSFLLLLGTEGVIPVHESAHARACAMKIAKTSVPEQTIWLNLSGRGHEDAVSVAQQLGL